MRFSMAAPVCGFASMASAATLNVTTTTDTIAADGQCSLGEAITAANSNAASMAAPAVAERSQRARRRRIPDRSCRSWGKLERTGDFDVTSSLTIPGAGADVTRIRGDRADYVFDLAMPGAGQPIDVTIAGVTIRNGDGLLGRAILNESGVSRLVSSCSIVNNTAGQGAGIASNGNLEVINSAFHANEADNGIGAAERDDRIFRDGFDPPLP